MFKQGVEMSSPSRWAVIGNAVFLATLLVFAHGLLKWVAQHTASNYIALLWAYWPIIAVSLVIYFFIFFYYAKLLKKHHISKLYPVYTGLSIIFLLVVGVLVFGEHVSLVQSMGCLMIILGILLVSK